MRAQYELAVGTGTMVPGNEEGAFAKYDQTTIGSEVPLFVPQPHFVLYPIMNAKHAKATLYIV